MIALRSNIRWCSNHFELACRNGEIVRVLFAIDACDREVMGWLAASAGISGEMVRDLMVACVERRFGISKAAHPVEWLSDNGSAYIAKDTLDTATALGLKLCFTPVRSPESNGIAEAFVKTFKRYYARLSILPDAETLIALLPAWFEDYNEVHPHSGLKFLSPREFLRLSAVRSNGVHTVAIDAAIALTAGPLLNCPLKTVLSLGAAQVAGQLLKVHLGRDCFPTIKKYSRAWAVGASSPISPSRVLLMGTRCAMI